ncbi:hypothetical protein SORBI_3003G357400 [Sorghum bicolor]|uniref:Uncharacterized protein n=1 Tax=Sorghum bicolor TaxID=4558 RepID=A0A1B6Q700_SORBI|nr:hypothetical protein SORBI_3003G357400 [Sorghum bicolor]KXG33703.1 hypothetical protein SORBI_3003G357400 [Sorghum bicolor]
MACRPISPQAWCGCVSPRDSRMRRPVLVCSLRCSISSDSSASASPVQSMLLPVPSLLPKKTLKQEGRCRQMQQERIYIVSTDLLPS